MREPNIEGTISLAEAACRHARKIILAGSTQIENNNLSYREKEAREIAMDVVRRYFENPGYDFLNIDISQKSYLLFEGYRYAKKYSIGNCAELSKAAFMYLLKNSNCHAERLSIHGGDHVFVVINRASRSNLQNPNTWGKTAVICDAFTNKVFRATAYKTQLKAYSYGHIRRKNKLIPFNPKKHKLFILSSTHKIRTLDEQKYRVALINRYAIKILDMKSALSQVVLRFEELSERLEVPLEADKKNIIEEKVTQIKSYITDLKTKLSVNSLTSLLVNSTKYLKLREKLIDNLRTILLHVKNHLLYFDDSSIKTLTAPRIIYSAETKQVRFFEAATVSTKISDALEEYAQKLGLT